MPEIVHGSPFAIHISYRALKTSNEISSFIYLAWSLSTSSCLVSFGLPLWLLTHKIDWP